MEKDFKFKITFSCEKNLQGKKLTRAIDDYHYLTPSTTKQIKSKLFNDDGDEGISTKLDDQSDYFNIAFKILKVFDNGEYKGKIIGYDSKNWLYQVEYEDGDKKEFYHNEIHAHRNSTKDSQVKYHIPLSSSNSNKSLKSYLHKVIKILNTNLFHIFIISL